MTNEWNCKLQRAGLRGGHSWGTAMNWWCWCFDKQIDHRKPELGAGNAALPARLYLEKTANLPPEFCEPDWWNRYFKPCLPCMLKLSSLFSALFDSSLPSLPWQTARQTHLAVLYPPVFVQQAWLAALLPSSKQGRIKWDSVVIPRNQWYTEALFN